MFTESTTSGSRRHLAVQMTADEINHLRATIEQLKGELHEERTRVDALKACLDQERDKYNQLSASLDQPHSMMVQARQAGKPAHLQAIQEGDEQKVPITLDQEVVIYYARKLETEQLQKMQLQNQVQQRIFYNEYNSFISTFIA